jgi:hypothetical protein
MSDQPESPKSPKPEPTPEPSPAPEPKPAREAIKGRIHYVEAGEVVIDGRAGI